MTKRDRGLHSERSRANWVMVKCPAEATLAETDHAQLAMGLPAEIEGFKVELNPKVRREYLVLGQDSEGNLLLLTRGGVFSEDALGKRPINSTLEKLMKCSARWSEAVEGLLLTAGEDALLRGRFTRAWVDSLESWLASVEPLLPFWSDKFVELRRGIRVDGANPRLHFSFSSEEGLTGIKIAGDKESLMALRNRLSDHLASNRGETHASLDDEWHPSWPDITIISIQKDIEEDG